MILLYNNEADIAYLIKSPTEKLIAYIDCSIASTESSLHISLQNALDLPDYYGANYDALNDCLQDESIINEKENLIVLSNSEHLLKEETEQSLIHFFDVLMEAADYWNMEHDAADKCLMILVENSARIMTFVEDLELDYMIVGETEGLQDDDETQS